MKEADEDLKRNTRGLSMTNEKRIKELYKKIDELLEGENMYVVLTTLTNALMFAIDEPVARDYRRTNLATAYMFFKEELDKDAGH
jgi:hypothetical protein